MLWYRDNNLPNTTVHVGSGHK